MEEMREVARAYYAKMSSDQQLSVLSFYKSLDTNGAGKVSTKEFSNFVKAKGNKHVPSNLFKLLDRNNDGTLDFDECVTLYYMFRVRRLAFCKGCGAFFWGVYFTCLDCYDDVNKGTYNLCCSCFRNNKFKHAHSLFVDNYHLLTIKRKAFAKQLASSSQVSKIAKNPSLRKTLSLRSPFSLGGSRSGSIKTRTLQVMLEESDDEGGDKDLTHLPVTESRNVGASRVEPTEDEVVEVSHSDEMGKESIKFWPKEVVVEEEIDDDFVWPTVANAKEDKTFILENAKVEAAGGEDPTAVEESNTPAGVTAAVAGARTASGDAVGDGDRGDTGLEEPFLNQNGSRGSFGQRDLGEPLSSHFRSKIQVERDQGEDTLDDMPRSKMIAGVYIGVEHYPILEEIEQRYPDVYSNLFPMTTWLTYGILTSFATFIKEVRYARVDDFDTSKIRTFLVALKDFEQTGLDVSWIRPRFEEAKSIINLRMFAQDLEVSKALIVERKRELAELETDVARRERELAIAKRAAPASLVDGDLILKDIF